MDGEMYIQVQAYGHQMITKKKNRNESHGMIKSNLMGNVVWLKYRSHKACHWQSPLIWAHLTFKSILQSPQAQIQAHSPQNYVGFCRSDGCCEIYMS